MTATDPARAATRADQPAADAGTANQTPATPAPAPQPPTRLADAIPGTGWTLQTPRLAHRHDHGWLAGYVSAVLAWDGAVDHWGWWVESAGAVVACDAAATPADAIHAADTALTALAYAAAVERTR